MTEKYLQVLSGQLGGTEILKNWSSFRKIITLNNWQDVDPTIPVYCFSDLTHENVRFWLNSNQLAIYGGRGYVGNHLFKRRWLSRMSVNGWANTVLKPAPYTRWPKMNLPKHPWKVKEVKKVLIAPSKATSTYWNSPPNIGWAEWAAEQFPGAEVKIRMKSGTPGLRWSTLWEDFDWSDLVVSQSSAITVEAFWYGKKVISTEPCITWAAHKENFESWNDPTEPKLRDSWHEHLAWSQFTEDEFLSGKFLNLLEMYLGPFEQYNNNHVYSIKI